MSAIPPPVEADDVEEKEEEDEEESSEESSDKFSDVPSSALRRASETEREEWAPAEEIDSPYMFFDGGSLVCDDDDLYLEGEEEEAEEDEDEEDQDEERLEATACGDKVKKGLRQPMATR